MQNNNNSKEYEEAIYDIRKEQFRDTKLPWAIQTMQQYKHYKNHYKLVRQICKGGQGSIFATDDNRYEFPPGQYIMTKVYPFKNETQRLKILQEYMIIRKLRIVWYSEDIYCDENEKKIYIVMEPFQINLKWAIKDKSKYIEGCTNLQYFILEIAGMLQRLHERSYVHLDIKPGNIMLRNNRGERGTAGGNGWKIIDFGLTKFIPPNSNGFIKVDHFSGTPNWEAPECKRYANKEKPNIISTKTDIFSFGLAILYVINGGNHMLQYYENIDQLKLKHKQKGKWNMSEDFIMFFNKSDDLFFDQFMTHYLVSLVGANKINAKLYNLLSGMLKYNQDERISALQIIQHHWLEPYVRYIGSLNNYFLKKNTMRHMSPESVTKKWVQLTSIQ